MNQAAGQDAFFPTLQEGRRQFLALVQDIRPLLHRYCARMTGSVAQGEDVVQDSLAQAYYELSELKELPAMRSWLFRIAHNRALDYLRRYERRMVEPLDEDFDTPDGDAPNPEDALAHKQAVRAAMTRFLELVPLQRSCVILKDVLDYPIDEIALLLDLSLPAVKAALHRGRERLRMLLNTPQPASPPRVVSPGLAPLCGAVRCTRLGRRARHAGRRRAARPGVALAALRARAGRQLFQQLRLAHRLASGPGLAGGARGDCRVPQ